MDDLICPVCGQANPSEAETCSNCGTSLHAPIQPGQPPVKKHTSELEPILPDWLRDAREKSREPGENEISEPPKKGTQPFGVGEDLLAGLKAQSDEDEADIPDWLASITGTKETRKESSEPTGPRRVELNDFEGSSETPDWLSDLPKPASQKPAEENLQDWFRQAVSPTPAEPASTSIPPAAPADNSTLDWLDNLKSEMPAAPEAQTPESGLPAWLSGEESTSPPASPLEGSSTPDWLKELGPAPGTPGAGTTAPSFSDDANLSDWSTTDTGDTPPSSGLAPVELPDWLKELRDASDLPDEEETQPASAASETWLPEENQPPAAPIIGESPVADAGNFAWLREMQEASEPPEPEKSVPAFDESAISPPEATSEPDWLRAMQESEPPSAEEKLPTPALSDEPDWFIQASTEAPPPTEAKTLPVSPLDEIELPDWLKDAAPGSLSVPTEEVALPDWMKPASLEPVASETPAPAEEELPDWLSAPAANLTSEETGETPKPSGKPSWLANLPSLEETKPEEAGELPLPALPAADLPSGGLESLFTPMPDWLSEATPASRPEPEVSALRPTPTEPEESLTPANLPSWVQAMRPVEAQASASAQGEEAIETQGPLAGLQGILPSLPYLGPANRPQAQSMKLDASTEQQNHGALLEQVIQSEIHPYPIPVAPRMAMQKGLRLAIGLLLFLALLGTIFAGTQILPLPVGWPAETVAAVQAVESIPAGSPVLVVFDYEPSLAGEMEAAAAPLLDHIIVRSHPVLTLLSTSPTGTALADRMFAGPLQSLAYQDRINLGYLPGGLGGVRSFVQNPAAAMPLGADSTPVTQGMRPYSEYSAILVITDSLDGGRTWIEQAGPPWYGGKAFVVVSSAQAGPMLQPYFNSGQINGLVSGLFDAAVLEQNNAGRPGLARRYWDAFNLGLMLSVLFITIGALWNLIAGLRDRPSAEAG